MSMIVDRHLTDDFAHDYELQATLRQSAHNNKLKKSCLDNEEHINQLHAGEYTDNVQYLLSKAHKKADEHLTSLEAGLKWNLTTTYDISKLMRQCGLELSVQELYRDDMSPKYFDLVPVKKEFAALRKQSTKAVANRPLLEQSKISRALLRSFERVEEVEVVIKASHLDATQMAHICDPFIPKIKECLNFVKVDDALRQTDDAMAAQNEMLRETKEAQQKALADGEIIVAEEAGYQIIATLEQLMELIGDKFAIINTKEEQNNHFQDTFELLRESNKKTLAMKTSFRRLKQRCETDLSHVHETIAKSDSDDVQSLADFADFQKDNSEKIRNNVGEQDQLWKDMVKNKYTTLLPDIISEMRAKGRERSELMHEHITKVEKEEMRKVEYQQFLEVVAHHKKTLEQTIDNCDMAVTCIGKFEQIMNDVGMAMRLWHDIINEELGNLRVGVHKEHLAYFREMYLCIGNLLYKKEKKIEEIDRQLRKEHIQLEFCVETFDLQAKKHSEAKKELIAMRSETQEEIDMLKQKAEQALEEFVESEEALKDEGYDFVHPAVEFQDLVMHQREKMVAYKAQFSKEEDVRIAAEREEIRRLIAISPSRNLQLQSGSQGAATPKKLEY